jgi:hypothetical protein
VDELGPILLIIIVGAAALTIAFVAHRAAEKRRQEMWSLARELGLDFHPGREHPWGEHSLFGCFKRGHSNRAKNTMRGEIELFGRPCPCLLGDFEYKVTRQSGKSRSTTTYRFSYAMFRVPWPVPSLTIRREHVLDKIAGALGFDDINFESEAFSRRFHVKCADKRFAYDVIHPRMMEFLLARPPQPLEFAGSWCIITNGSSRWTPGQFRDAAGFAGEFFGHWPEHLVRDLDARRGAGMGMPT